MVVAGLGAGIPTSCTASLGQHPLTAFSITIFAAILAFVCDLLLGTAPVRLHPISGRRLPESSLT